MLYPDMWLRSQPWRGGYFHLVPRTELKGLDQEATDRRDEETAETVGGDRLTNGWGAPVLETQRR
jgi:hypothetical protein